MIHNVRVLKTRPKWVCALLGHHWTRVGKESRYLPPGEIAYVFERCWRCMTDRRLNDGSAPASAPAPTDR